MKKLLHILLLVTSSNIVGQTTETERIFWDLIDYKLYPETYSDVGYVEKGSLGMFTRYINYFESDSTLVYYDNKLKKNDSIVLSIQEKEFLISELTASENHKWNLKDEKDLIKVEEDNLLEFLMADKNRELKIISKPIYIRNNRIVCLYSIHFCCGHFYGYESLSLYKKTNGKWKRWMPLYEGAY